MDISLHRILNLQERNLFHTCVQLGNHIHNRNRPGEVGDKGTIWNNADSRVLNGKHSGALTTEMGTSLNFAYLFNFIKINCHRTLH